MALLLEEPSMYSEMNNSVGCAAAGTAYRANRHTTTLKGLDLIAIMVGKLLIAPVTIACQILQPRSNHDRTAKFRTFEFPSRSGVILAGFRSARFPGGSCMTLRRTLSMTIAALVAVGLS